ncbi:MAG: transcription termination factor Rho, partial [Coprococcus catus]|nr:transcription termination factor Rho [Coprococcus catus]
MAEQEKKMSVAQMREILKAKGIRNTSVMRKAELQKLMAEMGLLENQSEVLEKDKEQPIASVEKGPEQEVKSENKKPYVFRGRTSRAEYAERTGRAERTERSERSGRTERTERSERTERIERTERPERSERTERTERPERSERTERTERSERQTYTNGGLYSGRRNTYGQRSENYQRNENSQRNESGQRGENYQRNDSYQREDSCQRVDVYQKNEYIQSNEESEIPGYGQLDSGMMANGILEVIPEGFGFIRCENYMPGNNDVYVSPAQIRRFNLRTGDIICGNIKVKTEKEKFSALLYIRTVNGMPPYEAQRRGKFENMTPVFPDSRINLETPNAPVSMRIMNLVSPIGRGQRGMIVSPPKAGKTTLLKQVALSMRKNNPEIHLLILLIDERPEEVTDIKEAIEGDNVEVIYSTFDELPEHHKRVSEMVIERAKRLVEHKKDVVILLDSIT